MQHRSFPRAIRGNILASVPRALLNHPVMAATDDPATIVKQLHNEVAGFVSRHESRVSDIDERINNLTSALDSVNGRVSGSLPAPGNGIAPDVPLDMPYTPQTVWRWNGSMLRLKP